MKKLLLAGALATVGLVSTAHAATQWTQWSNTFVTGSTFADPTTGSATGVLNGVTVTYSGELEDLYFNFPSWTPASAWTPASTWIGGPVDSAPTKADGIIRLFGPWYGNPVVTDTVTFSSPVTNPVIAIYSLGAPGWTASFDFDATPTIVAGGPSAEYGGSSISYGPVGNSVWGMEGNGSIVFYGTYSSISWTNPQFENWYGFTVGEIPEASTWSMLVVGFAALGYAALRRPSGVSIGLT
jgi:hypothetical protein